MLGLAIDSADRTASAALWQGGHGDGQADSSGSEESQRFALLAEEALPAEAGKADQLITVIERLLHECRSSYRDLDVIAVNHGPGSFTGTRSAVALARGLALAAGVPVLAVSCHEALAVRLGRDGAEGPLLIALDARRGEVFTQAFFADGRPMSEIAAREPATAAADLASGRWRIAGSGAMLVADLANVRPAVVETGPVDAAAVALAAARRISAGETPVEGFTLRPLYIRAPDAVPPAPLISELTAPRVSI